MPLFLLLRQFLEATLISKFAGRIYKYAAAIQHT
jgi:hypothetical protein